MLPCMWFGDSWTIHSCAWCSAAESCLTLYGPMDGRLPGFSAHGVFWTQILEWVAVSSSRGSSQPKGRILISDTSCIGR